MESPLQVKALYSRIPKRLAPALIEEYLTPEEQSRFDDFRFEHDRIRYAFSQIFLKRCLADHFSCHHRDLSFDRDQRGKPIIVSPTSRDNFGFNLSRCQSHVAVAIGPTPLIGVDVEDNLRVDGLEIAKKQFSQPEYRHIKAQPVERQGNWFLRIWSCKEAVTKAIGMGLAMSLNDFTINNVEESCPKVEFDDVEKFGSSHEWSLRVRQISLDCYLSVALRTSSIKVEWRESQPDT